MALLMPLFLGLFCPLFLSVYAFSLTPQRNVIAQYSEICEKYENNMFLYDIKVLGEGCSIECVFLDSSSLEYRMYFDVARFLTQHVYDGMECGHSSSRMCVSGSCRWKPSPNSTSTTTSTVATTASIFGSAIITVQKAHVPKKDKISKTDTYVQINLDGDELGRTSVVKDNSEPHFNELFRTSRISKWTKVTLHVYDHDDYDKNDFIGSVEEEIYMIIMKGQSGKSLTRKIPGGWIQFTIFWYPE